MLSGGATLTGTVVFNPGQSPAPDVTQVRITAPSPICLRSARSRTRGWTRMAVSRSTACAAGTHLVRSNGNLRGWTLKSVTVTDRDVTDTPIDVRSGQSLSNVTIVFTDKINEISGTITTTTGVPMPDYTVLAFPTRRVAVASAGAADRHDAARSDREIPPTRAPAWRVLRDDGRSRGAGRVVRTGLSRRASRRRLASYAGDGDIRRRTSKLKVKRQK